MCERTRNTTRCQESWLTDTTQTLAFSGCFVVLKYKTSLTTLSILLLRGHRWFRIRFTPSVHRRDQLAALHEGILHPIPSNLQTRLLASGVFGFPVVHKSSRIVEPMEKSPIRRLCQEAILIPYTTFDIFFVAFRSAHSTPDWRSQTHPCFHSRGVGSDAPHQSPIRIKAS
jgi:hypothetical protein